MTDVIEAKKIAQAIKEALDELKPIITDISQLKMAPGLAERFVSTIVFRAMVQRQHDALEATVQLVLNDHGYEAGASLRPACEELIWIRALKNVEPEMVERLLRCLILIEISQALEAQEEFTDPQIMKEWHFTPELMVHAEQRRNQAEQELREICNKLGWKLKRNQHTPSMSFLAKLTTSLDIYRLLYHATSREVHFSTGELLR